MALSLCKRCNGVLYTHLGLDGKETRCRTCGHEVVAIAQEVIDEVTAAYGKRSLKASRPQLPFNSQENVGLKGAKKGRWI